MFAQKFSVSSKKQGVFFKIENKKALLFQGLLVFFTPQSQPPYEFNLIMFVVSSAHNLEVLFAQKLSVSYKKQGFFFKIENEKALLFQGLLGFLLHSPNPLMNLTQK